MEARRVMEEKTPRVREKRKVAAFPQKKPSLTSAYYYKDKSLDCTHASAVDVRTLLAVAELAAGLVADDSVTVVDNKNHFGLVVHPIPKKNHKN